MTYSESILAEHYFYPAFGREEQRYAMKQKREDLWCPECEKLNRRTRLVRDECPECHYKHLIIKG